jgi:hypothetical protein
MITRDFEGLGLDNCAKLADEFIVERLDDSDLSRCGLKQRKISRNNYY